MVANNLSSSILNIIYRCINKYCFTYLCLCLRYFCILIISCEKKKRGVENICIFFSYIAWNHHLKIRDTSFNGCLPVIGFTHEVHLLANNSPKQSPQYGFSSLDVKRCPANDVLQWLHVKHSLCQGSFLYVTPPLVIICKHTNNSGVGNKNIITVKKHTLF